MVINSDGTNFNNVTYGKFIQFWSQFHQHFTNSVYASKLHVHVFEKKNTNTNYQHRKSVHISFFTRKGVRKMLMKSTFNSPNL